MSRARRVECVKLDTAKMHGIDTSNVSRRDEPSGIWAYGEHFSVQLMFDDFCKAVEFAAI